MQEHEIVGLGLTTIVDEPLPVGPLTDLSLSSVSGDPISDIAAGVQDPLDDHYLHEELSSLIWDSHGVFI